jgi:hypothetical protein
LPMFVPTMSKLAPVVIGGVECCSAILGNYDKLRTSTERWFECECIHIWAIVCNAYESRLKIQCPQESVRKCKKMLLRFIFCCALFTDLYGR